MNLTSTLKAAALSGLLLTAEQGCISAEGDNCSIEGIQSSDVVMTTNGEVEQFCKLNRDAIITCVETARGCPVSQTAITPCSDLQNNVIIQDAKTMARYGGDFFVTCVEGEGMMVR
jgi:hypothetical protein